MKIIKVGSITFRGADCVVDGFGTLLEAGEVYSDALFLQTLADHCVTRLLSHPGRYLNHSVWDTPQGDEPFRVNRLELLKFGPEPDMLYAEGHFTGDVEDTTAGLIAWLRERFAEYELHLDASQVRWIDTHPAPETVQ